MSASELAELEALLVKVLVDPGAFAERVLGELVERLATEPHSSGQQVVQSYDSAEHLALVDRGVLLAAALGACDCWGEDPTCSECHGAGAVGWVPPDPALYDEYIKPAVLRGSAGGEAAEPARAGSGPRNLSAGGITGQGSGEGEDT
jgi:hypothetical protein